MIMQRHAIYTAQVLVAHAAANTFYGMRGNKNNRDRDKFMTGNEHLARGECGKNTMILSPELRRNENGYRKSGRLEGLEVVTREIVGIECRKEEAGEETGNGKSPVDGEKGQKL